MRSGNTATVTQTHQLTSSTSAPCATVHHGVRTLASLLVLYLLLLLLCHGFYIPYVIIQGCIYFIPDLLLFCVAYSHQNRLATHIWGSVPRHSILCLKILVDFKGLISIGISTHVRDLLSLWV